MKPYFLSLALIILLITGVYLYQQTYLPTPNPTPIENIVDQRNVALTDWVYSHSERISRETAKQIVTESMKYKHGILMLSLFSVESNFVPSAVSCRGAKGLGQIYWPSHHGVLIKTNICQNERDLFSINVNIRATNLVLTDMLRRSDGNILKALTLYFGVSNTQYALRILSNYVSLTML